MFNRVHHQRIAHVLANFNCDLLLEAQCFFGGGTAIALSLGEYRESVDVDFLCSSHDGYRLLRNTVTSDLGGLLKNQIKHMREVRADRDAIRTVLDVDGFPIKVEIIREGNSPVTGAVDSTFGVPTLSRIDMFTQKLLANADRGMDKSTFSRDIIDIAMMSHHWGGIPDEAFAKAYEAYGNCIDTGLRNSINLVDSQAHLKECFTRMKMDHSLLSVVSESLQALLPTDRPTFVVDK